MRKRKEETIRDTLKGGSVDITGVFSINPFPPEYVITKKEYVSPNAFTEPVNVGGWAVFVKETPDGQCFCTVHDTHADALQYVFGVTMGDYPNDPPFHYFILMEIGETSESELN